MLSETVIEWTRDWKEEGKIEVARRMREMGLDATVIFQATGIRVEELDSKPERSEG